MKKLFDFINSNNDYDIEFTTINAKVSSSASSKYRFGGFRIDEGRKVIVVILD